MSSRPGARPSEAMHIQSAVPADATAPTRDLRSVRGNHRRVVRGGCADDRTVYRANRQGLAGMGMAGRRPRRPMPGLPTAPCIVSVPPTTGRLKCRHMCTAGRKIGQWHDAAWLQRALRDSPPSG